MKRYVKEQIVENKDGEQLQVIQVEKSKGRDYDYLIFIKK